MGWALSLGRLTLKILRLLIRLISGLIPWIVWLVGAILWFFALMLAALFRGVPPTCSELADRWTIRALAVIGNTLWSRYIYFVMYFFAILTMIVGWVIFSYITVFVVNFLFR